MGEQADTTEGRTTQGSFRDAAITDLYIDSVRDLIQSLANPVDKETCLVWLDFIKQNKDEQPVLHDYLMLLLLSLHQEVRSVPFDDLPPPIDEFKDIEVDITAMGQRIIQANREHQERKAKVSHKKEPTRGEGGGDFLPVFEWNTVDDSKEYFVSQKVPGFGRQSYYASSVKELPFWYPETAGDGDYLSRIATYLDWLERTHSNRLGECVAFSDKITTRNWWKEAQLMKMKEVSDAGGFKWHDLSILSNVKPKLDKKEIEDFYRNTEWRGMEILAMDEQAGGGLYNRTVLENERLAFSSPEYKSILRSRGHGLPRPMSKSDQMETLKRETEYNKSWETVKDKDKLNSEIFARQVNENSLRRLLQMSPDNVNIEDEAAIQELNSKFYSQRRSGNQPPPPSPRDINSSSILQRGLAWNIPAFKSPCKGGDETSDPYQTAQASQAPRVVGSPERDYNFNTFNSSLLGLGLETNMEDHLFLPFGQSGEESIGRGDFYDEEELPLPEGGSFSTTGGSRKGSNQYTTEVDKNSFSANNSRPRSFGATPPGSFERRTSGPCTPRRGLSPMPAFVAPGSDEIDPSTTPQIGQAFQPSPPFHAAYEPQASSSFQAAYVPQASPSFQAPPTFRASQSFQESRREALQPRGGRVSQGFRLNDSSLLGIGLEATIDDHPFAQSMEESIGRGDFYDEEKLPLPEGASFSTTGGSFTNAYDNDAFSANNSRPRSFGATPPDRSSGPCSPRRGLSSNMPEIMTPGYGGMESRGPCQAPLAAQQERSFDRSLPGLNDPGSSWMGGPAGISNVQGSFGTTYETHVQGNVRDWLSATNQRNDNVCDSPFDLPANDDEGYELSPHYYKKF